MEQLSLVEVKTLENLEGVIERGLNTFVDVGEALLTIRDERLYRQEYPTFEKYCNNRWNISKRHAYRLIDSANIVNNLKSDPRVTLPKSERQVRELTGLEPDMQVKVWQEAVITAPDGNITAHHVQQVVDKITKPHVANNSGNNEWYTPPHYIESARSVMGGIDLDPASSELANRIVKANTFFDIEADGLSIEWAGRVWMNPPYSSELIGLFTEKISSHFEAGDIEQACVLVNNATETAWFQRMLDGCSEICLLKGRVKFIDMNGNPSGAPLQGQIILYFGDNRLEFYQEFSRWGKVLHND